MRRAVWFTIVRKVTKDRILSIETPEALGSGTGTTTRQAYASDLYDN
jgi:hypothetical protein